MSDTYQEPQASSSSSLEEQLKSKLKKGLKPTSTKLTRPDGKILFLENQGTEEVTNTAPTLGHGFVVDTKPDLSISHILPWLYISSQDVPNDPTILSQNRITRVLSLLPNFELNPIVKPLVKRHLVLEVFDEVSFELNVNSPIITSALNFIHESSLWNENILVHCNAGLSRAPSIVMLYLMYKEKVGFEEAFQKVKSARPQAKPNEGFLRQLRGFKD